MAFRYLVDGYNLLYTLHEFPKGTWQEKRAHLLKFLQQEQIQGNNALTVVFDSRQGSGSQREEGSIRVIYTAGETADERIIDLVRAAANPRSLVVVSNDQAIRLMIKGTGARFITSTDFLKPVAKIKDPSIDEKSPVNEEAISAEFRRKWLY
jgi:uncharacterized protein